jgi:hypothetical protein
MAGSVRVWALPDLQVQHISSPPGDDVSKEWDGTTACGVAAPLRWIHGEVVDAGKSCPACQEVAGLTPPLEGDDLGPV